jgi:hypothetical protein
MNRIRIGLRTGKVGFKPYSAILTDLYKAAADSRTISRRILLVSLPGSTVLKEAN